MNTDRIQELEKRLKEAESIIHELVSDVESSGGVFIEDKETCPILCPDWTDLGVTYNHACSYLKKEPMIVDMPEDDFSGDDDDEDSLSEECEDEEEE